MNPLSDPITEAICCHFAINPSPEEERSGTSQTSNHNLTQKQLPTSPSIHTMDPLSDPINVSMCYHLAINPAPEEELSGTSQVSTQRPIQNQLPISWAPPSTDPDFIPHQKKVDCTALTIGPPSYTNNHHYLSLANDITQLPPTCLGELRVGNPARPDTSVTRETSRLRRKMESKRGRSNYEGNEMGKIKKLETRGIERKDAKDSDPEVDK